MCSIAGGKEGVLEMLEVMKHRSPDGIRVVEHEGYQMGMGRLAIIDPYLSLTLFPFEDDELILTFNGEIYNHLELRDVLMALGHNFTTLCDTEVLFRAYKEWGEGCLNRLNGMFAFAVYHKNTRSLFFARDIAGEKPFYYIYNHLHKYFEFASEAKALLVECEELPPAHCGIWDETGVTIWKWWSFEPKIIDISEEEALFRLELLLQDSIKLRTRSDVPYGLYLSGGVDSTLISTFHDFEYNFTYEDGDFKKEFLEVFPKIAYHLDYPLDSFSAFGLWKLAEEAKSKGVKVVLSGEGADELFGGYVRYVPNALNYEAQQKFPSYKEMFPYKGDLGWEDFNGKMRGLLRMGDRMASAHGVENRCPFLDRRIIEFAFSLPPELKACGFETKKILKTLLAKRKPEYKDREKHGLYCSVNEWLGVESHLDKSEYIKYQEECLKSR